MPRAQKAKRRNNIIKEAELLLYDNHDITRTLQFYAQYSTLNFVSQRYSEWKMMKPRVAVILVLFAFVKFGKYTGIHRNNRDKLFFVNKAAQLKACASIMQHQNPCELKQSSIDLKNIKRFEMICIPANNLFLAKSNLNSALDRLYPPDVPED